MPTEPIKWPNGKNFAFSVFDDTDASTLENTGPVYRLLSDLGLRTTKSVWPLSGKGAPQGATCEDRAYRQWLLELQREGFEIAMHGASYRTSIRAETIRALDLFQELFGHDPQTLASHTGTDESIYWFERRLSGARALLYNILTRYRNKGRSRGHIEGDPLFWGDLCQKRVKYVRNFIVSGINTLGECPWMPYHDPDRPYVNYWFASSPGGDAAAFNQTVSERAQDQLEAEGGACIMYAHFAFRFLENGSLNARFRTLMERLAKKNGFFVPVGQLLDYIAAQRGPRVITRWQRAQLEWRWLLRKIRVGRE